MRFHLSPAAEDDFRALLEYGESTFGRMRTEAYANALIDRLDPLYDNPQSAPKIARPGPEMRVLTLRSHIVIYTLDQARITVIRILDARQNWQSLTFD